MDDNPVIGFLVSLWAWLSEAWAYRPRRQRCAECQKLIWTYGELAPVICSRECEANFVNGIPF